MKILTRLIVAAALVLGLAVQAGPATAAGHPPHQPHPRFTALVFSKTAAFRHDSIPAGVAAIRELGARHHFTVDATEDAAAFTDANLARYDVVIWLSTTGDVLDEAQQAAFERYIRKRRRLRGHPLRLGHRVRLAVVRRAGRRVLPRPPGRREPAVPDGDGERPRPRHRRDPAPAAPLGAEEEWYNFRTNPRDTVRVLAEVDERTYDPRGYSVPGGSPGMGRHHPISWCQPYDGGRAFYTALGHKAEYYTEPLFLAHLLGGIEMAAGVARFACGRED
jgi:type 1 glutamine amidotransferase